MVKEIVKLLLDIEVVILLLNDLYIWSLGIKLLIYCDNCVMLGYFLVWGVICDGLINLIKEYFFEVEVIFGIVIVGILYVVFIVEKLKLLMNYVCLLNKSYGK